MIKCQTKAGTIAVISGFRMAFTWPLPRSFNVAYGEMSIFFGILFLGAALAIAKEWELTLVALYGPFAGIFVPIADLSTYIPWDRTMYPLSGRLNLINRVDHRAKVQETRLFKIKPIRIAE